MAAASAAALDDSKLSRAQRKNQKRAERKAAAAAVTADREPAPAGSDDAASPSHAGSAPPSPPAAPETESPAAASAGYDAAGAAAAAAAAPAGASPHLDEGLERCLHALVQHKLQAQVEGLTGLGFPPAAALAAVQQHGGNLEAALVQLLEQVGWSGPVAGLVRSCLCLARCRCRHLHSLLCSLPFQTCHHLPLLAAPQATGVQDGHGLGGAPAAAAPEVDLTEELQLVQVGCG